VAGSSNHLIRLEKDAWGNREPERFGGFEVNDQVELGGLLDGEVGGCSAFQELAHVGGGTPLRVREARPRL